MNRLKKETLFFYVCIALNALPLLLFRFFPTMDGPAHLYNANVLRQLWWGHSEVLQQYYAVNPAWVPNWTGHVLLAGLGSFLPAFLAEKVLLLGYAVGLPLAFRALVTRLAPGHRGGTYLIFPFVYNFLFCLGFYNLSLSLILLFAGLASSVKQMESPAMRGWFGLLLIFLTTYFTHPFSFTILVLGTFAIWTVHAISQYQPPLVLFLAQRRLSWVGLCSACLFPGVLLCHFYATQHFPNTGEQLSTDELMRLIKDVRPLISYHYEKELRLTEHLYHIWIGLTAIALYERVKGLLGRRQWKMLFRTHDLWLGMAALMLVLLFLVPNGASAGMMSDRFALFFFLFWVLWLALQPLPPWLWRVTTALVLVLNFGLTYRYIRVAKDQNRLAAQCVAAGQHIREGSVVLPFNFSGNWLAPHFSNYLGIEKPMVILENYEADTGWFPLLWSQARPSLALAADTTHCTPFASTERVSAVDIDYIFVLGELNGADSCQARLQKAIDRDYTPVYGQSGREVFLYRRRE